MMPSSAFATRSPCEKCPYRKDAPRGLWSDEEFAKLLAIDADPIGSIYGCHKQNGEPCIGWLLNQRERGLPSIALRLLLCKRPDAVACLEESHDGGHELFESVKAMCRANIGQPAPRTRRQR